ncbi:MAG: hypothetical protein WC133_04740 [Candidatus Omnitrophota bacterium]
MSLDNGIKPHNAESKDQKTCFLIYSTRENHVPKVIERLCDVLSNELNYFPIKLDEARVGGTPLLVDILKYTRECDIGIVILDGLRPNVMLELGMALANDTPCIILKEQDANINVESLISDAGRTSKTAPKIKIDISKHVSDISNISWNEYSLQDDTAFRRLIRSEIQKLRLRIKNKKSHRHQKYSAKIILLLRRIDGSDKLSLKGRTRLMAEARREMRLLPKDESAHISFHMARLLLNQNKYQTALREVAQGLFLSPNDDQLLALKGRILSKLGQSKEGLRLLKIALSKNPRNKYLRRQYLNLLNLNGNPKAVLKFLAKATYESLLIDDLVPIKAKAFFLDGQISDSLKLLIEMYEYDLNKWAIHEAMFLLSKEEPTRLPKELIAQIGRNVQRALERKHIRCYLCFARGCNAIGLKNLALRFSLIRFKTQKRKTADDLNEFAFDFIDMGEYKMARTILYPAIKKFPNHSYLNATWGLYKLKVENDLAAGKRYYSKAIDLKPEDMPLKRMYLYQLGKFYLRSGDMKLAEKNYKSALGIQTKHMQRKIQCELGCFMKRKGR